MSDNIKKIGDNLWETHGLLCEYSDGTETINYIGIPPEMGILSIYGKHKGVVKVQFKIAEDQTKKDDRWDDINFHYMWFENPTEYLPDYTKKAVPVEELLPTNLVQDSQVKLEMCFPYNLTINEESNIGKSFVIELTEIIKL
jgi:hypothetical protein